MDDCVARINDDLQRIHKWSLENELCLNPAKSSCLPVYRGSFDSSDLPPITLGNTTIGYVSCVKNLGIHLNCNMTCCDYISAMMGKIHIWRSSTTVD